MKKKKKPSYKQLYRYLYGEGEFSKGLIREYDFMVDILGGWKSAYQFLLNQHQELKEKYNELKQNYDKLKAENDTR
jgi:hypothetical protein